MEKAWPGQHERHSWHATNSNERMDTAVFKHPIPCLFAVQSCREIEHRASPGPVAPGHRMAVAWARLLRGEDIYVIVLMYTLQGTRACLGASDRARVRVAPACRARPGTAVDAAYPGSQCATP
jgi:hypothetical protein